MNRSFRPYLKKHFGWTMNFNYNPVGRDLLLFMIILDFIFQLFFLRLDNAVS